MKYLKQIIILVFLITFVSCNETNESVSPQVKGNIVGYVSLFDEYSREIKNCSNVKVYLADTDISTFTDSTGRWKLKDVSQGIYDICFYKDKFANITLQGFQFVGKGTAYVNTTSIGELPTFTIDSISAVSNQNGVEVTINIPDSSVIPYIRFVRYFVGKDSSITANSLKVIFVGSDLIPSNYHKYTLYIPPILFHEHGFESGNESYIIIYPATGGLAYEDNKTGMIIYPNLGKNPSKVLKVTVP